VIQVLQANAAERLWLIGNPAVMELAPVRPVTLRPRLSIGFAFYDFLIQGIYRENKLRLNGNKLENFQIIPIL